MHRSNLLGLLLAAFAFFFATVAVPGAAHAKDNKSIVVHVEGPDAEGIREALVSSMPEGLTVVDQGKAKGVLSKGGKLPFGKTLDDGKKRGKLFDKLKKAGEAAKVDAFLVAHSRKDKGGTKVHVWLLESDSDLVALDQDVAVKKKDPAGKAVAAAAASALKQLAPAPEPEPKAKPSDDSPKTAAKDEASDETPKKGDDEKEDDKEKGKDKDADKGEPSAAGARKKHDPAHSLFEVALGADFGTRRLSFDLRQTGNIRGYSVSGAPGVFVGGELYPLAGGSGFLRDIGLTLFYAQALGLKSAPAGGDKLATTWSRWDVGVRARIRTGGDGSPIVGVGGGYGSETFTIDATGTLAEQSPIVAYKFLRVGLDVRIPVGALAFLGGASFLAPSTAGELGDRFTGTKLSGFDAFLGAAYMISPGIEARLLGRYRHFSYAFSPNPGDRYIAAGASDTLASVMLGVAYVF